MDTNQKAAIAEAAVKLDLIRRGYRIAVPENGDLPFDLICVTDDLGLYKIQVKYSRIKNNTARLNLRRLNFSSFKKGINTSPYNISEIDVFALYVPNKDKCYYIKSNILNTNKAVFMIRFEKTISGQIKDCHFAENYLEFPY